MSEFENGSRRLVRAPTVLLVHGAFADATGTWASVIHELGLQLDVVAPANPLRGPTADAAYLASVAAQISGPVLLVGHSFGGVAISSASFSCRNVCGLVFVAAFAPDEGETILEITGRFPPSLLGSALRPSTYPANGATKANVELSIDREAFRSVYAADVHEEVASVLSATQRPIGVAGLEGKAGPAAWKTLPTWYAVATEDRVIHPEAQRFMAVRAGATTVEFESSHAIARTNPDGIAEVIRSAAAACSA